MSRRDADRGSNGAPWKRGRILAALLFLPLLAGCQQIAGNILQVSRVVIKERLPVPRPSQQEVDRLPYAQAWVRGLGRDARFVLGEDDAGRLAWYSGDGVILFTRNGMITGTHGLQGDVLLDVRIEGMPRDFREIADGHSTRREYDWMPGYRFGVPVIGRWYRRGTETVALTGDRSRELVLLEERLEGPGIKAANLYWFDPVDGRLWKSRQWTGSGHEIEMTVLKPYR